MTAFRALLMRDMRLAVRAGGGASLAAAFFALVSALVPFGVGADLVPNINGDPCSGYWESDVCLAENAPAVQPRSTLSTSP